MAGWTWYAFIEQPYLSYPDLPFRVPNASYAPGDTVVYRVARCNSSSKDQSYPIARTLPPVGNGPVILLPSVIAKIAPGCTMAASAITVIPLGTPPGRYFVEGLSSVQGLTKVFVVYWSTTHFDVVESKP